MDWSRKWFVDLNAGKTQLVSFDRSNNTGAIAGLQIVGPLLAAFLELLAHCRNIASKKSVRKK